MSRTGRFLVLNVFCMSLLGCSEETTPIRAMLDPVTQQVEDYVSSLDLPQVREIHQVLDRDPVEFFWVSFGPGQDCPSGCFYAKIFGVRVGDRVGWTYSDFTEYEPSLAKRFDVLETDKELFHVDLWFVLSGEDWQSNWYGLMPTLARDADTDRIALLNIAVMLNTHYSKDLSLDLVYNPTVESDAEILGVLSELPVFWESDPYKETRDRALELLEGLE